MDESDAAQSTEELQIAAATARSKGARARRHGESLTWNPYEDGSVLGTVWREGWYSEDDRLRREASA